jgi:hypothetical protein
MEHLKLEDYNIIYIYMNSIIPSFELVKSHIDKGKVSKNTSHDYIRRDIGEFLDVLAVAYGLKPLAGLDFSAYGRTKFKKLNKVKINAIIDFCNKQGVKSVYNFQKGGMYLKNIFYLPKNEHKALNLMAILWLDIKFTGNTELNKMYHQFYIGASFGYTEKNIQFFLEQNFEKKLTDSQIEFIKAKLISDKFTIEDLNKDHKIQIKTTTKLL